MFQAILDQYTYEVTGDMPTVSKLCAQTKADCDGLSAVFVSALRANQIPARMLAGLPAKSAKPVNGVILGHARAEFYAAKVGWVPVDPAYAKGMKKEPLAHFGKDRADLVIAHIDYELLLPFPTTRKRTSGTCRQISAKRKWSFSWLNSKNRV